MKEKFRDIKFRGQHSLALIEHADNILTEYRDRFSITLRGLYYQFVARDLFPDEYRDPTTGSTNNSKSYDKLGELITSARYAGLIDWDDLQDNTRELTGLHSGYTYPSEMLNDYAGNYLKDLWQDQAVRVEVWLEKDAIEGVVGPAARRYQVPYFSNRGYPSATMVKERADDMREILEGGQRILLLDVRDHDPSGIDMTRDAEDRLSEFLGPRLSAHLEVRRIALNMQQIKRYNPPKNFAKITDSRAHGPEGYIAKYGPDSWEVDALNPEVLDKIVADNIAGAVSDGPAFNRRVKQQLEGQRRIRETGDNWYGVQRYIQHEAPEEIAEDGAVYFSNEEPDEDEQVD